jgi:hypothetical protein
MLSKSHDNYGSHCDGSVSLAQTEADASLFSFELLHENNMMELMSFESA